jgi:hypothetical protein
MSTEAKGVAAATPNNRYNLMGVTYHALSESDKQEVRRGRRV